MINETRTHAIDELRSRMQPNYAVQISIDPDGFMKRDVIETTRPAAYIRVTLPSHINPSDAARKLMRLADHLEHEAGR